MTFILILALFPLLIVGAYFAGRSLSHGAPFRYRITPLNVACVLAVPGVMVVYAVSPAAPDGNNWLRLLTPFMLMGILLFALFDLALQLLLRNAKALHLTEAVLLALPVLAFVAKWFLGTGH